LRISISSETRVSPGPAFRLLVLALSLLAGLMAMALIFAFSGKNPFMGLFRIFRSGFFSSYGLGETVSRSLPLMLAGAGLIVAFRGKYWNIGAEGQLLAGASCATWVGLALAGTPGALLLPLMGMAAIAGGAFWGILAAYLKNRFSVNEIISTLMLNYILAEFVRYLIVGPWKGRSQHGFPYTDNLGPGALLALVPGTRIPWATLALAAIAVAGILVLARRTKFGYEIRVLGENREAARYAGIDARRLTLIIALISGGLAGLAGFNEVAANHKHMTYPETISAGYGFTAIIAAWLAKLDPRFLPLSSFFLAGIMVGGDSIQISMGLPAATVQVFNGTVLLFLIAGEYFSSNRLRVKIERKGGGAA
jgi:general nucleoside transport system permease protein